MLGASTPKSSYQGHDREEVTRILMQALSDMGYHKTASTLESESEYTLESQEVSQFKIAVLQGDWRKAEKLLKRLNLREDADVNMLLFYLRQQKFLECLEAGNRSKALEVMRLELNPLDQPIELTQVLTSLMLCDSVDDLKRRADWDGAKGRSRSVLLSELSRYISPTSLVPEHRLATILHQMREAQLAKCPYHNSKEPPSLYSDHQFETDNFPCFNSETLYGHDGEVWHLAFSHDGERLVSVGTDTNVLIWNTETFRCEMKLQGHSKEIFYACWSPDDSKILTSSDDNSIRIWDVNEGKCIFSEANETPVRAVCWAPDGRRFATGSVHHRSISIRGLDGSFIKGINCGKRVIGIEITPDARYLVAISTGMRENFLLVYNFQTMELEYELDMQDFMCSLQVTQDSKYALVNMFSGEMQKIKFIELETGETLQQYDGGKLAKYQVRTCLGGATENFVASGSLDSLVYIWHRDLGTPLARLPGHDGIVNAVSWNPTDPRMFATAGDDKTVRMYGALPCGPF
ncbi:WD domain-containing protein [Ascobolus immersus RN42]|uniref:WD domain-containing protein n=1 Tax=Ascobolus immersus RN42 TaxID=1160509 RepID=A0A3N4HHQ0_ASCIM|nr:WD domain-containing protein [Ascobolus immersus RN42]